MDSDVPIKFRVPRQDLHEFETFPLNAIGAEQWARSLPVTNTGAVAQDLRRVITELNRVRLTPETRYSILEVLRPSLELTLAGLARRYLNQPLVMPEQPRQMAVLAGELCSVATTAYTVVATDAIRQRDSIVEMNPARLTCEAIQRALDFAGRKILLTFQIYQSVELLGWLEVHRLYTLAERQQLEFLPIADTRTITTTYLQAILLGCCKPNQLRQSDLSAIYRGLADWAPLVSISRPPGDHGALFAVDLSSDQPPLYSSLYREKVGPKWRYLNTAPLISHLERLQNEDDQHGKQGITLDPDTTLPSNILGHLIGALGEASVRNFARTKSTGTLQVAIGLSSTHYYASGEMRFEQLLYGRNWVPDASDRIEPNPFLRQTEKRDLWQEANPEEDYDPEVADDPSAAGQVAKAREVRLTDAARAALEDDDDAYIPPEVSYPTFNIPMVDSSPGGYCLQWLDKLPGDVHTGDIVCVRESGSDPWAIAAIRWISRLEQSRTLIGLELLSPHATPYGARTHQKKGDISDPIRVLLLPEIKLVGQPHTLITPRAGFREKLKITLLREGEEFFIQLQNQITATGSFAQFSFRYIKQTGDVLRENRVDPLESPYDSIWTKI